MADTWRAPSSSPSGTWLLPGKVAAYGLGRRDAVAGHQRGLTSEQCVQEYPAGGSGGIGVAYPPFQSPPRSASPPLRLVSGEHPTVTTGSAGGPPEARDDAPGQVASSAEQKWATVTKALRRTKFRKYLRGPLLMGAKIGESEGGTL